MKYIIFIFLISINLNAQEIVTVNRAEVLESLGYTVIKTHQDSVMMDSINKMLEIKKKLEKTIFSLKDSNFSENLKQIVYETYAKDIDTSLEKQLNFLALNFKEYKLYGEATDSWLYNKKYILTNEFLKTCLGKIIINNNLLSQCDFFNFDFLNKKNKYKLIDPNSYRKNFIYQIAYLLKDQIFNIKMLLKTSSNDCLISNLNLIIDFGKKDPYLKEYYK